MSDLVSLLSKVCVSVAAVEERLRGPETSLPWDGLSEGTGSSSNIPEETDDVDNSSLEAALSVREAPRSGVAASPAPAEDGEGRTRATGGMQADCASAACSSPEPPEGGKCVEVRMLIHTHLHIPNSAHHLFLPSPLFTCSFGYLAAHLAPHCTKRNLGESSLTPPSPSSPPVPFIAQPYPLT